MGEALTSLFSGIGGSLSSLFGGGSSSTGGSNEPSGRADPYEGFTPAQRRLLGVAALQDAFASLAGQQGTALQRIAPVAEQVGWNEYVRNLSGAQPPAMPRAMAPAPQAAAPQAAPAATQPAPIEGGFSRTAISSALDRLARAESNSPTAVNRFGYAGQYQLGAPLAASAGIYRPGEGEINQQGRWSGQWGGTFNIPGFENVRTLQDFLANPDAQRRAAELSMNYQAGQLSQMGLLQNVGQEINGVRITPEALLQGAWLGGPRGVERFVRGGGQDRQDAFGTPVSRWMSLGQGEAPAAAPAAGAAPAGAQAAAQPSPLTPQQAVLAGGAPGQPPVTAETAALLRQLGPQAGRQFLAQMQLQSMAARPGETQQLLERWRVLSNIPETSRTPVQNQELELLGQRLRGSGTNVSVNTERTFTGALGDQAVKDLTEARTAARVAPTLALRAERVNRLLDSGAITGTGATFFSSLANALTTAGIIPPDAAANTQMLGAELAGQALQASQLLKGPTSDRDITFLREASAGNITFNEQTIRRIARLNADLAERAVREYNDIVEPLQGRANIPEEVKAIYRPINWQEELERARRLAESSVVRTPPGGPAAPPPGSTIIPFQPPRATR